ncbi:hypothetical protein [Streptomyces spirodelae]|uniref:PQQ-binding-like beta-propeller repeat protein n=1 Tax=Streptomyces spirodelae TaxID=2812904 RepID=A0ABS3WU60_9ACTN|nr:hypothetical protein [Streptomyces spirodelae]MBO8186641.1 hypothetical protein [Streptomyces spirodelae]
MSRSRTAALAAAALSVALAVTGCGPDDSGDGGGEAAAADSAPEAKLAHKVPMAKVSELAHAKGMWVTEKNFVKADVKKIVGYPRAGGAPAWTVPLTGETCWTSPEPTKDGLIAVVYENGKSNSVCTEVGVIDLKQGKMLWHRQAMESGSAVMFDEVTIGNGTVAAAGTSGSAGWTVGGKQLWGPSSDARCPAEGYAGSDEKLIAVRDCGTTDSPRLKVQTVNPRTRAATSTFSLPAGTENVHVVSTDPLVLAADDGKAQGGSGVSRFLSVDDSAARGRQLADIPAKGGKYGKYNADCPATEVTDCQNIAVGKETGVLYLGTDKPLKSGSEADNDIVAIDLRTGKRKAHVEGTDAGEMSPIGLDKSGNVLVYQKANMYREEGGAVWQLDARTLKKKPLLRNEGSAYKTETSFEIGDSRVLYSAGRLYLGHDDASKPSTGGPTPLAVVYSTKG